jgi:hypothetical protein
MIALANARTATLAARGTMLSDYDVGGGAGPSAKAKAEAQRPENNQQHGKPPFMREGEEDDEL